MTCRACTAVAKRHATDDMMRRGRRGEKEPPPAAAASVTPSPSQTIIVGGCAVKDKSIARYLQPRKYRGSSYPRSSFAVRDARLTECTPYYVWYCLSGRRIRDIEISHDARGCACTWRAAAAPLSSTFVQEFAGIGSLYD
jgi:hypothetical protein